MKKAYAIIAISMGMMSILLFSCKDKDNSAKCASPNFSVNTGSQVFKVCDAYAYNVIVFGDTSIGILAQKDAGNLVGFAFNVANRALIQPGTYVITNGVGANPAGQPFRVNFVYKEGGAGLENSFNSQSGTLVLTTANGNRFAGTFNGIAKRASGGTDTKTLDGGSFDVLFR